MLFSYEHTVYVLDAFIYTMNHWPKAEKDLNTSISSVSSMDTEELAPSSSQPAEAELSSTEPGQKHVTEKKRRCKVSKETEMQIKFFGMEVLGSDKESFVSSLRDAVQHKFPKVPKATWEVFTHNVSVGRQKSLEEAALAGNAGNNEEEGLPVTYSALGRSVLLEQ